MEQGLTVADFEQPSNFVPGAQQPSFPQLLAHLPEPARPKLERLADARDDAVAVMRDADRHLEELRDARRMQESYLRTRLSDQARRWIDEDGKPILDPAKRSEEEKRARAILHGPVERALAEEKRAQARYDAAAEQWRRWGFVTRAIDWIAQARRDRIRLRVTKIPAVKASDNHCVAVERIRAELAGLDEAWAAAQAAPVPIAVARENLFREIDAIAERGAPTVDLRRRSASPIPIEKALHVSKLGDSNTLVGDHGASFFVWFLQDEMKAKLGDMLEGPDPVGALTDEDRDRRFGEIADKRLELERLEEAHIVAAEAVGQVIARREDADLRAILEVAD